MTKYNLDDNKIVKMYIDGVLLRDMEKEFGCESRALYRRLRLAGIEPNRKRSVPWTQHEEAQLIDAVRHRATGFEYTMYVPTRTMYACKGHIRCWNEQM